ncbi:YheC/YheD family protein [Actinomycetes bacterium NPDC127524]
MLSLGILTSHISKEQKYFSEIAKSAKNLQVKIVKFCPEGIDTNSGMIQGESFVYSEERWLPALFPPPAYVYDRTFHGLTRSKTRARQNIIWLKEVSEFLGYGLPGKKDVYDSLNNHPRLSAFLPPTEKAYVSGDIWRSLETYKKVIIKPEFGSRGAGIYLLEQTAEGINVSMNKEGKRYDRLIETKRDSLFWLDSIMRKYTLLVQPYLELSNDNNEPFDVRILLQKNKENDWEEIGRGIRTGMKESITANLASGGKAEAFQTFNKTIPPSLQDQYEQKIQTIITQLPGELEANFQRLFEIGLDLGIDKKGQVWILDINSKPGRKIIEKLYPEKMKALYEAPVVYSGYLARTAEKMKAGE